MLEWQQRTRHVTFREPDVVDSDYGPLLARTLASEILPVNASTTTTAL
jgi:hypothetical protein